MTQKASHKQKFAKAGHVTSSLLLSAAAPADIYKFGG
jgi:hypothetical protein